MAALFGLALLGQVACAGYIECVEGHVYTEPEVAPEEAPVEEPPVEVASVPDCGMPICGPLGRRIYCIEGGESNHNGAAVNRSSGARGWLQWLASTARAWGVVIGDRQSEWQGAARIASRGEAFFRSQWVVLQLGRC